MAVGDGGMVGADFDVGCLGIDGNGHCVALNVGFDGETTQELYGEYPGFELAVLRADEDAAWTGYGERLRGLDGTRDDEIGLGEIEGRYWIERLGESGCRDESGG